MKKLIVSISAIAMLTGLAGCQSVNDNKGKVTAETKEKIHQNYSEMDKAMQDIKISILKLMVKESNNEEITPDDYTKLLDKENKASSHYLELANSVKGMKQEKYVSEWNDNFILMTDATGKNNIKDVSTYFDKMNKNLIDLGIKTGEIKE
ncbi:hypothetical protein CN692_03755 [Bacillus sp. AFS002410]|uniref:hypothetical protein n=1 Tax=Bacillus sp. AFS002410 TaxID=2033481 RepID=UPI000BEF419F|nr:hypothetical protein [Bacillus sp. AFS002410]PEJ59905.1 hypothetical protein CN692_03755 [Bacillus sp. AFS002410]